MGQQKKDDEYVIILPSSGKGKKELDGLYVRRKNQFEKAIEKLRKNPTNLLIKGIEKLKDNSLGQYTIRVSRGDRIFYDVDQKRKIVYILRAGKHDLYKLL